MLVDSIFRSPWRDPRLHRRALGGCIGILRRALHIVVTFTPTPVPPVYRPISTNQARPISSATLDRFAEAMRDALCQGDIAFRRAYVRLFVDEIVLSDGEISLSGPKDSLARSASIGTLPPAGVMVPSFVRKWRPVGDSNPCRRRERAVSWASRRTGRGWAGQ